MAAPVDFLSFAFALLLLRRRSLSVFLPRYPCASLPLAIPTPTKRDALFVHSPARVDMCKTKYVRLLRQCARLCVCVWLVRVCVGVIIAYLCGTSAAAVSR